MSLKKAGLTLRSVLPKGKPMQMLPNANLSTGGTSVDMTDLIHPFYKGIAVTLTRDMGLRLCGVDLMISEGDITNQSGQYYVIEVNSAPGLDHYAAMGRKQTAIVEALYTKVFIAMGEQ